MTASPSSIASHPASAPPSTGPAARSVNVNVGSVMTTRLFVATPSWSLLEAARSMRTNHVSGLPVVDADGAVVGVLSEKDILRDLDRAVGIGRARGLLELLLEFQGSVPVTRLEPCLRRLEHGRVGEAMRTPVVCTDPGASIGEASRLLREHRIKRLPVVSQGSLVGIVTRENLVEALAEPGVRVSAPDGPWSRHHRPPHSELP